MALLVVFLVINTKKKPFSTMALNNLKSLSLFTSLITIYCSMYFLSDISGLDASQISTSSGNSVSLNQSVKVTFFVLIVLCNASFFLFWGYKMYDDIKYKFRKIMPKVYIAVCLCFDKHKLEKELAQEKIDLENIENRENFVKMLSKIKQLQANNQLILNHKSMEKIRQQLDPKVFISFCQGKPKPDYAGENRRNRVALKRVSIAFELTCRTLNSTMRMSCWPLRASTPTISSRSRP